MADCYMVVWEHRGTRHVLDFDDAKEAGMVSIMLEESGGRSNVSVTLVDIQEDPELKTRIWERVKARLTADETQKALADSYGPFKEAIRGA